MDLETNMKAIGKRFPHLATYQVGFSKQGVINAISINVYANSGMNTNDQSDDILSEHIDNGEEDIIIESYVVKYILIYTS